MEYKIINRSIEEAQKLLNQWKHKYELEIIQMISSGGGVTILLIRKEKDKNYGEIGNEKT